MATIFAEGFETKEIVYVVLGGVILAAVLAVFRWIIKPLAAAWRTGLAGSKSQLKADAADDAEERLVVLRDQVRDVAEEQGLREPDHATGHNPTIVTYTDGHVTSYFSDHAAYRRAMTNRTTDPRRSFVGAPPQPVSEWDEETLQDWLAEHTTQ
ncbi:hypothetical protein [Promicromonospora aerolata]|uniref:Uncharacterized protein n=1 Tax=Promicromonospora aerolata TaxID=195749 RepID=A0ABW4V046_9MICO